MTDNLDSNPAKVRRKRTVAKKKTSGHKTLVAAVVACVLATIDLYMTLRLGWKVF